mmetsp:Transcript_15235/g.46464  ORF Transcript_15235/g.46464 Transcript_15235/m.46464 type:complete len:228 (+) Transcript_15235:2215-2898(+)
MEQMPSSMLWPMCAIRLVLHRTHDSSSRLVMVTADFLRVKCSCLNVLGFNLSSIWDMFHYSHCSFASYHRMHLNYSTSSICCTTHNAFGLPTVFVRSPLPMQCGMDVQMRQATSRTGVAQSGSISITWCWRAYTTTLTAWGLCVPVQLRCTLSFARLSLVICYANGCAQATFGNNMIRRRAMGGAHIPSTDGPRLFSLFWQRNTKELEDDRKEEAARGRSILFMCNL